MSGWILNNCIGIQVGGGRAKKKLFLKKIIIIIFHRDTAPLGLAEPLGSRELKISANKDKG